MIIGSALQASAFSRTHMIIGRIVSGLGLGTVNSTVPVLQAEFSPEASRGVYVCAQLSTLNFGICIVYWIDYAFSTSPNPTVWRIPVILQIIPLLAVLVIVIIIPESPRWLAAHGRADGCLDVLAQIANQPSDNEGVRQLHASISQAVAYEDSIGTRSWRDLLKEDSIKSRKRLLLACAIQSFQQLGGINAIVCKRRIRTVSLSFSYLRERRLCQHVV